MGHLLAVPLRFIGVRATPASWNSLGTPRVMPAAIRPGATQLTVMPRGAHSMAAARDRLSIAPLAAP